MALACDWSLVVRNFPQVDGLKHNEAVCPPLFRPFIEECTSQNRRASSILSMWMHR